MIINCHACGERYQPMGGEKTNHATTGLTAADAAKTILAFLPEITTLRLPFPRCSGLPLVRLHIYLPSAKAHALSLQPEPLLDGVISG
jgi:hypothetical protein